jgi:peroxiredoxin
MRDESVRAAEAEWLDKFSLGPSEREGCGLPAGTPALEFALPDHSGRQRRLSEFWSDGPALLMFWRHFGCLCGVARTVRLRNEYQSYVDAGLNPVIVGQGEPARAAAYRSEHDVPCPVLCDPEHRVFRAYGVGQWAVERVLYDAPAEFWNHPRDLGAQFQDNRRTGGRPPVDDPWRAAAEYVIGSDGLVRLAYMYQYCEDFPNPAVLTAAARLSRATTTQ